MKQVYNFSAGPAILPEAVLKKAQEEMLCYKDTGISIMEMSHRSKEFKDIILEAENLLRELMGIPSNYKVLFLQGGASSQFAMVPLNLFRNSCKADYVNTGRWSQKAIEEAKKYGKVRIVASSKEENFNHIPDLDPSPFDEDADYFYITTNNTIYGTRYTTLPNTKDVPLIADMSSNILSEPCDVSKFGIIFAGAQKNIGPAGLTVVIIRDDLIGQAMDITPTMFNYKIHVDADSMYNTPPTYSIYIAKLVFEWIKKQGGLEAIAEKNRKKAKLLYDYIDRSSLFKGTADKKDRSLMNVTFVLPTKELDAAFIEKAAKKGLINLKGHRSIGGMRASIYNAMPIEGVQALVDFMKAFEEKNI
ncbi:MAG: 3-phosphoserine/phosphohydroxythreonine transaminase [Clostridiaceae bacterium]|nr:3-phosphoserine/phosphohydroxythreonine transaminase [Clostridiaceae bacterium]MBW4859303.1 3-phosphoserine/phosphohydroxythreonine transaminase [Clostridiaceae bacterium]MBW4868760.1 3-phosphoserine/phosphohydroxythreonine transaminase [Clostridiaceae bacterium]